MKFTEFGFDVKIIKALENLGFEEATEVQQKSIPLILEGKNLVVRSQTGSGKTFAFALPLLQNTTPGILFPETLIICPTRELTLQVCDEIKKITGFMEGVKVVPVYGGSNITRQVQALKRKPQIIVGTPGRILDHIDRKTLKLHYLKNVVLDEADEMLNMGFKEDIEKILKGTPENKRTLLFSATYPERIKQIVKSYMQEHEKIEIGSENKSLKNISQEYVLVNKKDKVNALLSVMEQIKDKHTLIFCNTKAMAEKVSNTLNDSGFNSHSLHGDLKQSQRKIVTNEFKFKKVNVLVASDVAARGLDINDIDFVINFDLPSNLEYFLHRMGRTARAGKNGSAITIVSSNNQLKELKDFERQTTSNIAELKLEEFTYNFEDDTPKGRRQRSQGRSRDSKPSQRRGRDSRPAQSKGREKFADGKKSASSGERRFSDKKREFKKDDKKSSDGRSFGGRKSSGRKFADKRGSSKKTDFKNKAVKVSSDFEVSERMLEKVKRKKEMASGKGFEEKKKFKKPSTQSDRFKSGRKPLRDKEKSSSKGRSFDKKKNKAK